MSVAEITRNLERFRSLAEQWVVIEDAYARRRHIEALNWVPELHRLVALERRSSSVGRWVRGPTDLMAVLRLDRNEVRNCRVLAWLLDPVAAHGLGTRMLGAILAQISPYDRPSQDALVDARIRVEDQRQDTRADVVVYGDGWSLVIEAKINAGEQGDQGNRLEMLWGLDNPTLCFLTRDGRQMRTGSGKWTPLRWADIARHLRAALADAPPAAGRPAAEEYLRSLEIHLR